MIIASLIAFTTTAAGSFCGAAYAQLKEKKRIEHSNAWFKDFAAKHITGEYNVFNPNNMLNKTFKK